MSFHVNLGEGKRPGPPIVQGIAGFCCELRALAGSSCKVGSGKYTAELPGFARVYIWVILQHMLSAWGTDLGHFRDDNPHGQDSPHSHELPSFRIEGPVLRYWALTP